VLIKGFGSKQVVEQLEEKGKSTQETQDHGLENSIIQTTIAVQPFVIFLPEFREKCREVWCLR